MQFTVKTDRHLNLRMILDINVDDAFELGNALLDACEITKSDKSPTVIYRIVTPKGFSSHKPRNSFVAMKPATKDDSEFGSMPVRVSP